MRWIETLKLIVAQSRHRRGHEQPSLEETRPFSAPSSAHSTMTRVFGEVVMRGCRPIP